jgi:hypothetical protein
MHSSPFSAPKDRSEILWIFDTIKNDKERWFPAYAQILHDTIRRDIGLWGDQRDDTLMQAVRHQPIERGFPLNVDWNSHDLSLAKDLCKLTIRPQNEQLPKRSGTRTQRFSHGMKTIKDVWLL